MRVIQLIARLNDGGPARVVRDLALALDAAGDRCAIWHGAIDADEVDLGPELVAAGIIARDLAGLGRRVAPLADLRALLHLICALRRERPDLVHTHTAKAGTLGRIACALLGIPCLHTFHGHILHGYFTPGINRALRCCERLLGARCHLHSLTPSLVRELALGHRLGRAQRWHLLPVPVRPVTPTGAAWHRALPDSDAPVVGFLGRCAPVKDLTLWLHCLHAIAARRPVCGVVCGDGPERAAGEALARRLGLAVHFAGTVPAGEALGAMDLLLMTSRNEGLPLAAVEAAGAGIPVVAPAVGGLRDLADAGLVVAAPRRVDRLSETVEGLLDDPATRAVRAACARRAAAALHPEVVTPRYRMLYRRLIHRVRRESFPPPAASGA